MNQCGRHRRTQDRLHPVGGRGHPAVEEGPAAEGQDNNTSFVEALLRTLLSDQALLQQAKANTAKQFAESPDLRDSVWAAIADDQGAHNKRAEYFYGEGAEVGHLMRDIAWAVHEFAIEPVGRLPRP